MYFERAVVTVEPEQVKRKTIMEFDNLLLYDGLGVYLNGLLHLLIWL